MAAGELLHLETLIQAVELAVEVGCQRWNIEILARTDRRCIHDFIGGTIVVKA